MQMGSLRHTDFRRFWSAESISYFGSAITMLALPLCAVIELDADEKQMGILSALGTLPFLLIILPAGAWLDRRRRRPVMVAASLARGLFLLSVPLAVWFDALTLTQLYVVNFGVACGFAIDSCAHRAYLPTLVGRDQLVEANSKLSVSHSVAETAGPGLAGLLVKFFSAPIAIFLDALSYFTGAVLLWRIKHDEPVPAPEGAEGGLFRRVLQGLRALWAQPDLRAVMLCGATHNICSTAIRTLYILYMTHALDFSPTLIGLVYVCGGIGAVAGGWFAPQVERRLGTRGTLVFSQVVTGIARVMIPFAAGPWPVALGVLCLSQTLLGGARPLFNVCQLALRGRVIPDHLQGRVTASFGFLMWGFTPLGALVGGFLGAAIGMRPTLIVAAIGVVLATGWLLVIRTAEQTDSVNS